MPSYTRIPVPPHARQAGRQAGRQARRQSGRHAGKQARPAGRQASTTNARICFRVLFEVVALTTQGRKGDGPEIVVVMALARLLPRGSPRRYMLCWLFICCRTLGRLAFRSSRTRSFFSHALMAARKRDDVQSYTDASHFTEEMSCQLSIYTIYIYQRLESKRISYHVLLLLLPPPPPPLPPPLLI